MVTRKLNNKDWKMIEDRIERKLSSWKGKHLSYGGRIVLINYVLSSLPMFMLSLKKSTTTNLASFGRGIRRNIGQLGPIVSAKETRWFG